MTTRYSNAVDEIFDVVNVAWNAGAAAIVGYTPEIRWQGIEEDGLPDSSEFWARISQQTVDRKQTTFAVSTLRYTVTGLLFVQLFGPKSDVSSMEKLRTLAEMICNALDGVKTDGGVIFRNTRPQELLDDEGFKRINVVSEYEFDEVKGV